MGRNKLIGILQILFLLHAPEIQAQENSASMQFNNDIWNKTDRYYTSGLHFSITHQALVRPLSNLLNKKHIAAEQCAAALNLFQDLYTPSVYNTNVYNPFDRPYAAILGVSYKLSYVQAKQKHAVTAELMAGVIGKAALGEEVQNGLHEIIENLDALGWSYQIRNGFLCNINLGYEQRLIHQGVFHWNAIANSAIGSYQQNLEFGTAVHFGPKLFFQEKALPKSSKRFSHAFSASTKLRVVAHDASLQGAYFQNYTYGLAPSDVNRYVLFSSLQYQMRYENFQCRLVQNFISPEFKQGLSHRWVGIEIGLTF